MHTVQKKVCLLGDFAVGKTSLIRRFVEGVFDDKYLTTVGVVVTRKSIQLPGVTIKLLIWDLAGGRDFSQSGYLVGAAGAMLVCDLTREPTLLAYRTYAEQLRRYSPHAAVILLANKVDLEEERALSNEQLQAIAQEMTAPLLLTSAKTGENVEAAFVLLANALI